MGPFVTRQLIFIIWPRGHIWKSSSGKIKNSTPQAIVEADCIIGPIETLITVPLKVEYIYIYQHRVDLP